MPLHENNTPFYYRFQYQKFLRLSELERVYFLASMFHMIIRIYNITAIIILFFFSLSNSSLLTHPRRTGFVLTSVVLSLTDPSIFYVAMPTNSARTGQYGCWILDCVSGVDCGL